MNALQKQELEQRIRALQREKLRRMKNEKYRFYEPSGKAEDFIDYVACGDYFIVLFSAANGVGKTATGCNILAHLFWNNTENPYFQGALFKNFPFKKQGRIISDPTNLQKNIVPQLKEWFPYGRYTTRKGNKNYESLWETDTGWNFDMMTYEQDTREFEGVTLGWAWFDEPPPQAIFKATVSRMRKGGIIFITATPLAGSAYLYDSFATGNYMMEAKSEESGAVMQYKRRVGYIEADIESACKTHGIRGHLRHDDIMQMVGEYSEDEKQARIYGKFQHLVGLVYKRFNPSVHVIRPFNVTMRDYVVYNMLDPHPRNPDAILWVAVDKHGTKFVVDELFIKPYDVDELAERIKAKDSLYRVVKHLADPSAFNVNQHDEDGKSLAGRLADRGLSYQPATKQRAMSDKRIEDALNYNQINGVFIKVPELYIFENCARMIFEFHHYRWDDYTGKNADKHNAKEKPVDKDDHMIECLGRALVIEPRFEPYIVEKTIHPPRTRDSMDPYA
jgi:phage terminase large subunit-like protein